MDIIERLVVAKDLQTDSAIRDLLSDAANEIARAREVERPKYVAHLAQEGGEVHAFRLDSSAFAFNTLDDVQARWPRRQVKNITITDCGGNIIYGDMADLRNPTHSNMGGVDGIGREEGEGE